MTPQARAAAAQAASNITMNTTLAPVRLQDISPATLTGQEAQRLAAQTLVASTAAQLGQAPQEMANRLAADPRFIEAAGTNPADIVKRVQNGELQKQVQEIAKNAAAVKAPAAQAPTASQNAPEVKAKPVPKPVVPGR